MNRSREGNDRHWFFLRGDVLNILYTISEDNQDYKISVANLETRYGDKLLPKVYKVELAGRIQQYNEIY